MNRCGRWAAFLLAAAAVAGCRERAAAPRKREIPLVYTTFYPTTYFAKRIGGSRVKVVCPVPAGEDPIFWMPDSATIAAYQQAGYAALAGELDQLHKSLEELSAALEDRPLLASHPAYNYLAARYGWNLTNLSLDPETMPDAGTLAKIKEKQKEKPARIILWEKQPPEKVVRRYQEELGLVSVEFSPCELPDPDAAGDGGDYLSRMRANVKRLRTALSE